jgi:porin
VYGDYTTSPQNLAFQTGSTIPAATLFGEASLRVMQFHWSQGLFDGRAGFVIGHIFPDDYFSHHQLMNPLTSFQGLGSVFSPSIHLPNAGLGVGVGVWVADQIQVKLAATDASGDAYGDDFWDPGDEFFDGNFFKTGEVAWIPEPSNPYAKRVALTGWHADPYEGSSKGYGVALASNWTVGKWVPFLLGGWSNGGGANTLAEKTITAGTGYRLDAQDVLGTSFSWVDPVGDLRSQYTTEIYVLFYVTGGLAVTPNLQWVINPALNTDVGSMTYFQIRARFAL